MGVLSSKLFTTGDAGVVQSLENCAVGVPNEVQSHFNLGKSGEDVRRLQEALTGVRESNPGLGIPAFAVNGIYDQQFANAVRVYKDKRQIRNFAGKIDDIIGVNTIRTLDRESKSGPPKVNPAPPSRPKTPGEVVRPLGNCVADSDCPTSREFDIKLIAGATGGEVVELGLFFFSIRDTTNGLSAGYKFRTGGGGIGALPVSLAGGGATSHFTTSHPVRVTRFGPGANIRAATIPLPVPGQVKSFAFLIISFLAEGLVLPRLTFPFSVDTGPVEIPGVSIHAGPFSIIGQCNGQPGAVKRILSILDFPG